jgi:hypothetical protein
MDVISPNNVSYVFDQNQPSPIHAFSSSLEEKRKCPKDGESTLRLRNTMKKSETRTTESVSHPDSDDDGIRRMSKTLPSLVSRNVTAQAEAPLERGFVKERVAFYGGGKPSVTRHLNLAQMSQSKKNSMKPKQVGLSSVMFTIVLATE